MGLLDRFRRTGPSPDAAGAPAWTPDGLPPLELGGRIPGPVIPFGPAAFVLAAGDGCAIAAASQTSSGGRIVALGHDGLWSTAPGDRTVAAFLQRVLTWCAPGRADVGLIDRPQAERTATAAGLRSIPLATPALGSLPLGHGRGAADRVGTVVVRGDTLDGDDAVIDALTAFVEHGGSVIVDSTPWGWLQLHDGTLRDDHGANRLVRRFGMCFTDGLVEPARGGTYAVPGADLHGRDLHGRDLHGRDLHGRDLHGLGALAALRAGRPSAVASSTLLALVGGLPGGEPFLDDVRAVAGSCDPFAITAQRPVGVHDVAARLAARLWLADGQGASTSPLPVYSAPAPAVTPVTVPAGRNGWISTGLHARPGERITVRLTTPRSTALDVAVDAGMTLRIGAQTDTLWHAEEWKRFPEVAAAEPITGDVTALANPFGGLVYVELEDPCPVPIELEIAGGTAAPRYVLGATGPDEWRRLRGADAPWSEIEGRRFVLTVPSWATRALDDPAAVCAYWDEVLGRCHELAGVGERTRPERYVCDVQISHGYLHAGYPVMGHDDIAGVWTDPHRLRAYDWNAAWALFHETGHNFQEDSWTFDGTVEVTCNLFSLYCAQTVHGRTDDAHPALVPARRQATAHKRHPSFEAWKSDPFLALDSYRELIDAYGWDAVKAVIASYRDPAFGPPPADDADARGQWAVRYSRVVGRDLSGHFDAWGIPIPDAARRACRSAGGRRLT